MTSIANTLASTLIRRVLVNFRCDPALAAPHLPAPFTPTLVRGHAVVGLCLVNVRAVRTVGFPSFVGLGSENVAHRIAASLVDSTGKTQHAVFIFRRHTSSHLSALAGGKLFPGYTTHAAWGCWNSLGAPSEKMPKRPRRRLTPLTVTPQKARMEAVT